MELVASEPLDGVVLVAALSDEEVFSRRTGLSPGLMGVGYGSARTALGLDWRRMAGMIANIEGLMLRLE